MDRRLSAGIALFAALTLSACVDGSWGDRVRASVSETRPMAKDGKFSLDNTNGRIEVTGWDEARVSIEATKRAGSDRALREMEIEIDEDDGDVRVRTRHRRSRLFGGQGRVDYLVKVPRGVHVDVRTVNGGVQLAGLDGEVSASSTNGGIKGEVGAASRLDARTVNGGVELRLAQPLPDGSQVTLKSVNGGVRLAVPDGQKADVVATCVNGRVDASEVALAVSGEATRRRVEGQLNGGGGARLDLGTTNGGVRLTKA